MPPKNDLPRNWPPSVPYLRTPIYSKSLTSSQLTALRTRPPNTIDVPLTTPLGPCPLVRITPITNPSHPAFGQSGLFGVRDLAPGSFILVYIGEIHESNEEVYGSSDYDLSIDRDADLSVDASRSGNEARFVNDFRGVPSVATDQSFSSLHPPSSSKSISKSAGGKGTGKKALPAAGAGKAVPNAEFREIWDGRPGRGERCMGVFVLPQGKGGKGGKAKIRGIKKGEEILVSYGRGFWGARTGGQEEEQGVNWGGEHAKGEEENGES